MSGFGFQEGRGGVLTLWSPLPPLSRVRREAGGPGGSTAAQTAAAGSGGSEEELLRGYHQSFDDEQVDLDLVMDLLHHICSTGGDGEAPGSDAACV